MTRTCYSFEEATYHIEHWNYDLNFVGKFALSEVTREHGFKVVLTGEGSDEHFAGYPPFGPEYLREPDETWPSNIFSSNDEARQKLLEVGSSQAKAFYDSLSPHKGGIISNVAASQLNNSQMATSALMFQPPMPIFAQWSRTVYGGLDARETSANNVDGRIKELIRSRWHPLHSSLYIWNKSGFASNILSSLGDRVEMSHSVEARTPFLDHHLTEYINMLPPSMKVRCDTRDKENIGSYSITEKWILREAARDFITDEMYRRRKHAYSAPAAYPANGPLHTLFQNILTKENVDSVGLLDWDEVVSSLEQAFPLDSEQKSSGQALRVVFMSAQLVVLGKRFGVKRAQPENFC